jgi:hypothetical protein
MPKAVVSMVAACCCCCLLHAGGPLSCAPSCSPFRPSTQVIDARAHMLGRLASIVAKQILAGHQIVRSLYEPRGWCGGCASVSRTH